MSDVKSLWERPANTVHTKTYGTYADEDVTRGVWGRPRGRAREIPHSCSWRPGRFMADPPKTGNDEVCLYFPSFNLFPTGITLTPWPEPGPVPPS